jgi:hypothetical protein
MEKFLYPPKFGIGTKTVEKINNTLAALDKWIDLLEGYQPVQVYPTLADYQQSGKSFFGRALSFVGVGNLLLDAAFQSGSSPYITISGSLFKSADRASIFVANMLVRWIEKKLGGRRDRSIRLRVIVPEEQTAAFKRPGFVKLDELTNEGVVFEWQSAFERAYDRVQAVHGLTSDKDEFYKYLRVLERRVFVDGRPFHQEATENIPINCRIDCQEGEFDPETKNKFYYREDQQNMISLTEMHFPSIKSAAFSNSPRNYFSAVRLRQILLLFILESAQTWLNRIQISLRGMRVEQPEQEPRQTEVNAAMKQLFDLKNSYPFKDCWVDLAFERQEGELLIFLPTERGTPYHNPLNF